jgi:hypothetical protein
MEDARDRRFTIEEAASILGCSESLIYELLAEGWLKRPVAWAKTGESGRVSEKSLFQFMIMDHVNLLQTKTLRELQNGRKHFGRIFSRNAEANCLSSIEGTGQATENAPSKSLPQDQSEKSKQCRFHNFAAQRQFSFGWKARQLAPGDPALQDDLVQEMSLAVLEYEEDASPEFLFELATNRAKNYLKYEAARGMLALSEAQHVNDLTAARITSLNNFIEELLQRGVPVEWIEEVLGQRLDVA